MNSPRHARHTNTNSNRLSSHSCFTNPTQSAKILRQKSHQCIYRTLQLKATFTYLSLSQINSSIPSTLQHPFYFIPPLPRLTNDSDSDEELQITFATNTATPPVSTPTTPSQEQLCPTSPNREESPPKQSSPLEEVQQPNTGTHPRRTIIPSRTAREAAESETIQAVTKRKQLPSTAKVAQIHDFNTPKLATYEEVL